MVKTVAFLCTCREGRLIGFKFVEVVPLENIFMLRLHRLRIKIGDGRFHHLGQEQVRKTPLVPRYAYACACACARNAIGTSRTSLTISAKPVGVGATSQP